MKSLLFVGLAKGLVRGLAGLGFGLLLVQCAVNPPVSLPRGTPWREVAEVAGAPTCEFSCRMGSRKIDVVAFEKGAGRLLFENGRLLALPDKAAWSEWDRLWAASVKVGRLPFEGGMRELHSWVERQSVGKVAVSGDPVDQGSVSGNLAGAAANAVILAPIAPILLSAGVVGASQYAMTGGSRQRAREVNETLLDDGLSYGRFLACLPQQDLDLGRGAYRVRQHFATRGSVLTGLDHDYAVGMRGGRVEWVAYRSWQVRERLAACLAAETGTP